MTLKDLVFIENSLVSRAADSWKEALKVSAPLELEEPLESKCAVINWILNHGLRIRKVDYFSRLLTKRSKKRF